MVNKAKIFNIGFHKTGTTSLTHFMQNNGYKTIHSTAYTMQQLNLGNQSDIHTGVKGPVDFENILDKTLLQGLVREFDFFSDNPWPLLYKLLDQNFPNSKFILTRRDPGSWINSLTRHSASQHTRMRQLIYGYGSPDNHAPHYRQVYIKHNRDVAEYFGTREDLLIIDIESDDGLITASLADFLGLGNNLMPFPTSNKA